MADRMLFCAICGGPVRPPTTESGSDWAHDVRWQVKVLLLNDPSKEFEACESHYRAGKQKDVLPLDRKFNAEIGQRRATATRSERLLAEGSDVEIVANSWFGFDEDGELYEIVYSIVNHEACVDIAARAIRASPVGIHIRSMRALWKALRTRFDARDNEYMGTVDTAGPQYIMMDHNYYMPLGFADDYSTWEGDDEHWSVADPIAIPNLTEDILSNLETFQSEAPDPTVETFRQRFLALPTELRDRIVDLMGSFEGLSAECTSLLPQETWRDILLGKRYLPFLWDLDYDLVAQRWEQAKRQGNELNWELLVRKLSAGVTMEWQHYDSLSFRQNLFCYPDMHLPKGLRNRRRIWQLMEEMYVGDVVPVMRSWVNSKQLPTMPRYWDEYGEPAFPVVRIEGVREDD
ncbi:hypothetical protein BX600DRAFT_265378 [Xylariales sp. PMI_506]|nr:hypothetical protein BX600DRAFT_265378 [Xylariales sp. PMI_506]